MRTLITLSLLLLANSLFAQQAIYTVSESKAKEIVSRVLKTSPVIDGHNDLFIHYMDCKECPRDLKDYRIDTINKGHTDIPRMRKGGVGAVLMNVSGRDSSLLSYHKAWDLLYRMEKAYKNNLKIVGTSTEMRKALNDGKIAFLPILEGAIRLNNDPALLRTFYKLGLRSVTFAYKTNGLADGSDDTVRHNGISDSGRVMIKEMNHLGVLIDMSHISAKAMNDILDITEAPIIFSHSNARALCDVNRNVPDDVLLRLKKNKGIIMLTFVPYFVKKKHSEWLDAGDAVYYKAEKDFAGNRDSMNIVMDKWEKENPEPLVTVTDMADHFDYVKKLIGIDHIGMAGDYDGISFTIKRLENTSTYPNLLVELARRGWTETELKKITGGNFLRVFEEVEKKAQTYKGFLERYRDNQKVSKTLSIWNKTILAIFPHPDDETAIAEVLVKYAALGYKVQLIIATDGKDGTRVTKIPAGDSLGNLRKEETRCACKIMGIEDPIFLGIERLDTKIGVGKYFREHKKLLELLKTKIDSLHPDFILTFGPDGDTHHAEHIVTGAAVTELLLKEGWVEKYPLYYIAWTKTQSENYMEELGYVSNQYFNVKVEYTQEEENRGLKIMPCYATQYTPDEIKEDYQKKTNDKSNTIHFRRFALKKGMQTGF